MRLCGIIVGSMITLSAVRCSAQSEASNRSRPYIGVGIGILGFDDAVGDGTLAYGIEFGMISPIIYAGFSVGRGGFPSYVNVTDIPLSGVAIRQPHDAPHGRPLNLGAHLGMFVYKGIALGVALIEGFQQGTKYTGIDTTYYTSTTVEWNRFNIGPELRVLATTNLLIGAAYTNRRGLFVSLDLIP